jgi:anthranilate phosphoribosyltransferase
MLGPLTNPARPQFQLAGVFNLDLARLFTYLFQKTPVEFGVIHGLDGYDEISLTGAAKYLSRSQEVIIRPVDFSFSTISADDIQADQTPKENADRLVRILKNQSSKTDKQVVLANAAVALLTAQKVNTLSDGVLMAEESIVSGSAYNALKQLVRPN